MHGPTGHRGGALASTSRMDGYWHGSGLFHRSGLTEMGHNCALYAGHSFWIGAASLRHWGSGRAQHIQYIRTPPEVLCGVANTGLSRMSAAGGRCASYSHYISPLTYHTNPLTLMCLGSICYHWEGKNKQTKTKTILIIGLGEGRQSDPWEEWVWHPQAHPIRFNTFMISRQVS